MLGTLSTETLEAILDILPVDLTFIDAADIVRYYNKGSDRIFQGTAAVIGRRVQDCHPQEILPKVEQALSDLKAGRKDVVESCIDLRGRKLYVGDFAVRDRTGKYIGTLEVTQDITNLQKL